MQLFSPLLSTSNSHLILAGDEIHPSLTMTQGTAYKKQDFGQPWEVVAQV